jgi:nitrite reductase (NADH) small subunit
MRRPLVPARSQGTDKEGGMAEQWRAVCKLRDIPLRGAYAVARGLAWQELPSVRVFRSEDDQVVAQLDGDGAQGRRYAVRVEEGRVYLDQNELNAPASKAEAALAGSFGTRPHV